LKEGVLSLLGKDDDGGGSTVRAKLDQGQFYCGLFIGESCLLATLACNVNRRIAATRDARQDNQFIY
jgi:hypothetical protein